MLRVASGEQGVGFRSQATIAVPSLCAARSVPAFKPDNVHAKTFRATQQVGINRATK